MTPDPPKDKGNGSLLVRPKAEAVDTALPDKNNPTRQGPGPDQKHGGSKPNDSVPDSPEGVTVNKKLPDKKASPKDLATTSSNSTRQSPGPDSSSKGNDSLLTRPEVDTLDTELPSKPLRPNNIAAISPDTSPQGPDQEPSSSKGNDNLLAKPEIDTVDTKRPDQKPSSKDPPAISPDSSRSRTRWLIARTRKLRTKSCPRGSPQGLQYTEDLLCRRAQRPGSSRTRRQARHCRSNDTDRCREERQTGLAQGQVSRKETSKAAE